MRGSRSRLLRPLVASFILISASCATAPPPPVVAPPPPPPPPEEPAPWLTAAPDALLAWQPSPASARGGAVPSGLRGRVFDARFGPDGTWLAVVTSEKVVGIVDARTGMLRAARRIRVRRESVVRLDDLDASRVLLTQSEYGEEGATLTWDLAADAWQVVADDASEGLALTARGALVRVDAGVVHVDAEGRRVLLGEAEGAHVAGDRVLLGTNDETRLLALPARGDNEARELARVPGRVRALRPGGGLVATSEGDLVRVARLDDGAVVFERAFEGVRDVAWRGERFVVEAEHEGAHAWHRFDGTDGRAIDVVRVAHRSPSDLLVGEAVIWAGEDGSVVRRSLEGEVLARWREPFPADVEPDYDPFTGEPLGREVLGASADGSRVLLRDGADVLVLDATTGERLATVPRDDDGTTSVWGVVATPGGLVAWGRSHVSHWSEHGARVFACRGSGFFFGDDASPGWSAGFSACIGDRRSEWPMWDDEMGIPAWSAGKMGRDLVVLSGGRLMRADARTLRLRGPVRVARDLELECYEEGCDTSVFPFGRALLLRGAEGGVLSPDGRLHVQEGRWLAGQGGERALFADGGEAVVVDPSGREVREVAGAAFALDPSGRRLARAGEREVVVEDADDGANALRLEDVEVGRLELRESALLGLGDDELFVWHLPTGALRARLARRAHVALDATGERFAVCDEGRLSLRAVTDGRRLAELGTCELADSLAFVASDRLLAIPSRTQVTLVRLADGARLVLHGHGDDAYADDGAHAFATAGLEGKLRWRAAGSLLEAPLTPLSEHRDPELLRRFFALPAAP